MAKQIITYKFVNGHIFGGDTKDMCMHVTMDIIAIRLMLADKKSFIYWTSTSA